mgnify:CR=1 FL=1
MIRSCFWHLNVSTAASGFSARVCDLIIDGFAKSRSFETRMKDAVGDAKFAEHSRLDVEELLKNDLLTSQA